MHGICGLPVIVHDGIESVSYGDDGAYMVYNLPIIVHDGVESVSYGDDGASMAYVTYLS